MNTQRCWALQCEYFRFRRIIWARVIYGRVLILSSSEKYTFTFINNQSPLLICVIVEHWCSFWQPLTHLDCCINSAYDNEDILRRDIIRELDLSCTLLCLRAMLFGWSSEKSSWKENTWSCRQIVFSRHCGNAWIRFGVHWVLNEDR